MGNETKKVNYYFTFCSDHPVYANVVCKVTVELTGNVDDSYRAAREKFVNKFGTRWAFQYDQAHFDNWPNEEWYKWSPPLTVVDFDKLRYVNPDPARH